MKRKLFLVLTLLLLVSGFAFAQDLKVEYQLYVNSNDTSNNFFSFIGPIRYISTNKDQFDAATGASKLNSTELFQPYIFDVTGKKTFPAGLRGLFLFAVSGVPQRTADNLAVSKASDGTITIQYVHRGTAYKLVTDRNGRLNFPAGDFQMRAIGYIQGAGPQVLSRDFSRDGTADTVNWAAVWNSSVAGGKEITAGVANRTGNIVEDAGAADAMYQWSGALQVTFDNNILRIWGGLNAQKR